MHIQKFDSVFSVYRSLPDSSTMFFFGCDNTVWNMPDITSVKSKGLRNLPPYANFYHKPSPLEGWQTTDDFKVAREKKKQSALAIL